ncbi:MAG: 6-carboxytetrahydropterin synthase QueD [Planctomycetota bacterium]|jgi:6-pyruvoyltetrahydropterin/6-carboxytetrahydropterin synthase
MYDKLTGKAQKVFKYARQEAHRMGHECIEAQHLLVGIIREGRGLAAVALRKVGLDPEEIRRRVGELAPPGDVAPGERTLSLSAAAKAALERSFEEARRLGQDYIGTEHLVLGLLADEEGIPAQALLGLGVEVAAVRGAVHDLLAPAACAGEESGTYELTVEDTFAAAHNLREYHGDCERLHGHNWRVRVRLSAGELDDLGMVADFRDVKAALGEVLATLDHEYLNEVAPFDSVNPTTENLCRYIAEQLQGQLPRRVSVRRVTCWESAKCSASYTP